MATIYTCMHEEILLKALFWNSGPLLDLADSIKVNVKVNEKFDISKTVQYISFKLCTFVYGNHLHLYALGDNSDKPYFGILALYWT